MTAGAYDDGGLGEVFLKLGKQGSTLAGVMDAFSIAVSIGLQYGVPLETYVSKFTNLRFEPAGLTDDPDVRMAQSIMDYIFRRLALDYLPSRPARASASTPPRSASASSRPAPTSPSTRPRSDERGRVERARAPRRAVVDGRAGRAEATPVEAEPVAALEVTSGAGAASAREAAEEAHTSAELLEKITGTAVDAPLCMTCGTKMRPAGSCYVCEGCGSTSGCS